MFYLQIFRTNIVFSSNVWLGAKNSSEKHVQKNVDEIDT